MKIKIKGFENYELYDTGDVFNTITGKQLKGSIRLNGYKEYRLSKNNQHFGFYAHRLVAEYFIPNPNNLPVVNHKDENRANNNVGNLEWCSHAYNLNYGTAKRRRAISQGKVVLQLDKNGTLIKRHLTLMDACRDTGIDYRNISLCCNHKRKTAGWYCWKFD